MVTTMRDLEDKDVVNICSGSKFGRVCDLEIDTTCGKITAFFVTEGFGGFWQNRGDSLKILWENVRCVGEDAILVEVQREIPDCTRKRCRFLFG